METNTNTEANQALNEAGKKLIEAAYEFWKVHQIHCGPSAVVWLNDDAQTGHFVLFTRGEYKSEILRAANIETRGERPLQNPFTHHAA